MQALQMSSRLAGNLSRKALVKPQSFAALITRGHLTPAERKARDAAREKMQYPDDTPVYLRGGAMDRFLYGTSIFLVTVGVLTTFVRVYQRANV